MIRRTFYAVASWAFVVAAVAGFIAFASQTQREFSRTAEIAAKADEINPKYTSDSKVQGPPDPRYPLNASLSESIQFNTTTISK